MRSAVIKAIFEGKLLVQKAKFTNKVLNIDTIHKLQVQVGHPHE